MTISPSSNTNATSTINGNLYVNGTLRSKVSYVGDLVFKNGFRFVEAPDGTSPDYLNLNNAAGANLLSIDENGNLSTTGDVCAYGTQCLGASLNTLTAKFGTLASSTATFASAITVGDMAEQLSKLDLQVQALATSSLNIASSTASELASSTSFIQTIANAVIDILQKSGQVITSAGDWVVHQITAAVGKFDTVIAGRVETQTASVSDGLEMTDTATGQIYCIRITNGDWNKQLGTCASVSTTTQAAAAPEPQPVSPTAAPVNHVQAPPLSPLVVGSQTPPTDASSTSPEASSTSPDDSSAATSTASSTGSSTSSSSVPVATSTAPTESTSTSASDPLPTPTSTSPASSTTPTDSPAPTASSPTSASSSDAGSSSISQSPAPSTSPAASSPVSAPTTTTTTGPASTPAASSSSPSAS